MKSIVSIAALAAVVLASTVAAPAADPMMKGGMMKGGMMMKTPVSVTMGAQNDSGETGSATLRDTPKGVVVTMHLKAAKGPQPAHIHMGSCAKLNPKPMYPLHNVVNGMSITTVPGVTVSQIVGKTAINVHKSPTDIATYVSCGDVAKM